jgi:hypothetical protein
MTLFVEIAGPFGFTPSVPPQARFDSAVQRLDGTFLVDLKFSLWKDCGSHRYAASKWGANKYGPDDSASIASLTTVEFSINDGLTWVTAHGQTYDRKHTAINPLSFTAIEKQFDFVWNAFFDLPADFNGNVKVRLTITGSTIILTSSLFVVSTVIAVIEPSVVARRAAFKIDDFLGEGPIAPWRRGPSDFMTARGIPLVASAVRQILATRAATAKWGGELPWDPSFGSLFWTLPHSPGDEITEAEASGFAGLAMAIEPRVKIIDSKVDYIDRAGGLAMFIRIRYKVAGSNNPDNRVFQAALNEVTIEV